MSSTRLQDQLDGLIACFNRRVMDVPEELFDRNAQFTLNGRTFESMLGRADDDPLVRLIARGAAGYRFAAKPLLHALETALVSRMDFNADDAGRARAVLALRGTLRGSGTVLDEMVTVDLALTPAGTVRRADVMIGEGALDRIRAARAS
ncbi:MAG: hypothetical protein ACRD26_13270 [Vicinamibacterales bacterium]